MYDYNDDKRAKSEYIAMFNSCNNIRIASGKKPYTLEEYDKHMTNVLTKLSKYETKRFPQSFLK